MPATCQRFRLSLFIGARSLYHQAQDPSSKVCPELDFSVHGVLRIDLTGRFGTPRVSIGSTRELIPVLHSTHSQDRIIPARQRICYLLALIQGRDHGDTTLGHGVSPPSLRRSKTMRHTLSVCLPDEVRKRKGALSTRLSSAKSGPTARPRNRLSELALRTVDRVQASPLRAAAAMSCVLKGRGDMTYVVGRFKCVDGRAFILRIRLIRSVC